MATTKFKYNINHIISYQPKWLTMEEIASLLEKAGIPTRTFYNDRAIKVNEDKDITGERLLIYSKFFGVSMKELFNYDKKVKTLDRNEPAPSDSISKLMKRTGLKIPR